jgi:hypothetical protein
MAEDERWVSTAISIDVSHILLSPAPLSQAFPRNQLMAVEVLW